MSHYGTESGPALFPCERRRVQSVNRAFRFFFGGTLMLLSIGLGTAVAQETDKKEPAKKEIDLKNVQTPGSDAQLPKIDLPEFVITGSENINLNVDSKRVEDRDRLYSPSAPTPGERPINVGEAVIPKQVKTFSKTPGALNGKLFAGVGFYGTPLLDGWFGQYDPVSSIVANGYYSESAGHVNDAGFWRGGFGVRGSYSLAESSAYIPLAQLSGESKYSREVYRSYGSRMPGRVRDISSLDISGGIGSRYALPYKSMSSFDYSAKTGWSYFSLTDSAASSESEFHMNGTASTRFLETALRASLEYRLSSYDMNVPGLQSGHWMVLRGDGRQQLTSSLQISYALQQFLYRGNILPMSGRLYPNIEIRYIFTDYASMVTGFAPSVERNTLSSLLKQNRYIYSNAQLLPTDTRVNLYLGMEISPAERITATAKLTHKQMNNYATFLDRDSAKVWEVLYLAGIQSTKFDLSAIYRFNQQQNVTAYFSTQSVKQRDSSGMMPYLPKFTFGSVYHHFFDFGLHLEAFAEYSSSRFTDFGNTHSTAGYLASGVKGEIELFEHFRGFAELNNLLNQRYYIWNGYQERSIYLLLGISYNW